jgi:hypothetical protein
MVRVTECIFTSSGFDSYGRPLLDKNALGEGAMV